MVKCYRKSFSLSDLWVTSNERVSDFYASSWQKGDSPVPLLVVRIVLTTIVLGILVWSLVEGGNPYWPLFLTNWGLLMVSITMVSGTVVSLMALIKKPVDGDALPWYMSMYWFVNNIAITLAFVITLLYWVLLYNPENRGLRSFWLELATHGFNSCIAFSELFASRTPVRLLHMYQPLGVGLWYSAFTWIYYSAGGTDANGNPYIYEILDWRQNRRTGSIIAMAMTGLFVLYIFVWCFAMCRDKISSTLLRTTSHDLQLTPPDKHIDPRIV